MLGVGAWTPVVVIALLAIHYAEGTFRRVCYYTNWSQYRPSAGQFMPENVDPTLCTHIIYAFSKLNGNRLASYEWNDESTPWSTGMYERFQNLKTRNPALKTLLAIGGWNMQSGPFTRMVATQASRAEFVQSVIEFLRKQHFDGLDLDWEYPANRGSPPSDRDLYTRLLMELRSAFEQEAVRSGRERLLLTAAVAAGKSNIDTAYDVSEMNKYLDFFNLMSYDLHGAWETVTGHHAALFPRAADQGDNRYLNVDFAAHYWVQKGASRDKLVIGLTSYGRSFTLSSPAQNGIGAPVTGAGQGGADTHENGFLAYYEVCQLLQRGGVVHQDPEQHVRYVTLGDQWVGVEDEQSITEKVCYAKQQGFGGVMLWALDEDDFLGHDCNHGPYPLLHAINREVANPGFQNCPNPAPSEHVYPEATTTQPLPMRQFSVYTLPTLSPPVEHTTTAAPVTFSCLNLPSDFYPSLRACNEYIICVNQVSVPVRCPEHLAFDPATKSCIDATLVHCVTVHPDTTTPLITTTTTTTTTTTPPTTTAPPAVTTAPVTTFCRSLPDGLYPDVLTSDPSQFITCLQHQGFLSRCLQGYVFSSLVTNCVPSGPTTVSAAPHITTPPLTATIPGPSNATEFCRHQPDGSYRDPNNCSRFVSCYSHIGVALHCPSGMVFNQAIGNCQYPYNTPECAHYPDPLLL